VRATPLPRSGRGQARASGPGEGAREAPHASKRGDDRAAVLRALVKLKYPDSSLRDIFSGQVKKLRRIAPATRDRSPEQGRSARRGRSRRAVPPAYPSDPRPQSRPVVARSDRLSFARIIRRLAACLVERRRDTCTIARGPRLSPRTSRRGRRAGKAGDDRAGPPARAMCSAGRRGGGSPGGGPRIRGGRDKRVPEGGDPVQRDLFNPTVDMIPMILDGSEGSQR
jgi:hypothetical protein